MALLASPEALAQGGDSAASARDFRQAPCGSARPGPPRVQERDRLAVADRAPRPPSTRAPARCWRCEAARQHRVREMQDTAASVRAVQSTTPSTLLATWCAGGSTGAVHVKGMREGLALGSTRAHAEHMPSFCGSQPCNAALPAWPCGHTRTHAHTHTHTNTHSTFTLHRAVACGALAHHRRIASAQTLPALRQVDVARQREDALTTTTATKRGRGRQRRPACAPRPWPSPVCARRALHRTPRPGHKLSRHPRVMNTES